MIIICLVIYEDIASKLEKHCHNFFQVSIHFHPCRPQQQTTCNSLSAVKMVFNNKTKPLFAVGIQLM